MKKTGVATLSLSLAAFLIAGGISLRQTAQGQQASETKAKAPAQQIVINLKHYTDDLHAAFMAMKIGKGLQEQGGQVTLFVNLEGARLADTGTPIDMSWGMSHTTMESVYTAFVGNGGKIVVCPHCAAAAGLNNSSLREGANIATEQEVIDMFLAADKVIDY